MHYPYELPDLPYAYDALEPTIDEATMKLHHSKHHATYIEKLNTALKDHSELHETALENLLANLDAVPEDIRTAVRNHGGGHYNHELFWQLLTPKATEPAGHFLKALETQFGSLANFQKELSDKAASIFGSGWAWLAMNQTNGLEITTTPNQDTPLPDQLMPLLGLDVWEHAYYLKYQNRRADYIEAWWKVVNWDIVNKLYEIELD